MTQDISLLARRLGRRLAGVAPRRRAARAMALGATLLGLTACEDDNASLFAPTCPPTEIVAGASDSFTYEGRGLDVGSLVDHTSIEGLNGSCAREVTRDEHDHKKVMVRTKLSLSLHIRKGAAAHDSAITVPYFVAVMHNGQIVDKKVFSPEIGLDPASNTTSAQTPVISIDVPADRDLRPEGYSLEVGLQLTRAQLDYNRSHLAPVGYHEQ